MRGNARQPEGPLIDQYIQHKLQRAEQLAQLCSKTELARSRAQAGRPDRHRAAIINIGYAQRSGQGSRRTVAFIRCSFCEFGQRSPPDERQRQH